MILIENPFPLFTDNNGELLESGYIYIGEAGLNPETNPINVFWDKDLLYPAAQPIRTINGLPSRNGTATPLYTASVEYSLMTKDKNQVFVSSTSFYPTEVVPADGSVTGPKIDDTAAFIFPTLLSLQKGADIAPVAGVLTLGIDGNSFDVTGTDPITSIASIGIGTQIILQFNDALVFTYDATDLILQGGANITTEAGDHAIMVEYDTGKWKCVSYIRASGLPVLLTGNNTFTGITTVIDNAFFIADNGDNTKKLAFEASNITAATTRTITVPDADMEFDFGDYSPTLTNVANVSSVGNVFGGKYSRVGNYVQVSFHIATFTVTATSTATIFRATFPIASNIDASDVVGTAAFQATGTNAVGIAAISGDAANDEANVLFYSFGSAGTYALDLHFMYKVI